MAPEIRLHLICFFLLNVILYHKSESQDVMSSRNDQLTELSVGGDSYIFEMNKKMLSKFVTGKSRDYSIVLQMNALDPKRGCGFCVIFYESLKLVASSWNRRNSGSNKVYFAVSDYDKHQDVMQTLGIEGVPVILVIKPSSKGQLIKSSMTLRSEEDLTPDAIAKWLGNELNVKIKVVHPIPWFKILSSITIATFVCGVLYLVRNSITKVVSKSNIIACVLMTFIYLFAGGMMWVKINNPPFSTPDASGGKQYISSGNNSQYGAEVYVIMMFYAAMSIGFLLMSEAPFQKGGKTARIGLMLLGLGLYVGFFQLMVSTAFSKASYLPHKSILWWL
ncbi:Uncharacterised protein g3883 [Pycnogonum litorale]